MARSDLGRIAILGAGVLTMAFAGEAALSAAESSEPIISAKTDRPDALYKCGEKATFLISVERGGRPVPAGKVQVSLTFDGNKPLAEKSLDLGAAPATVFGTLQEPGFLRCAVRYSEGKRDFYGLAAAGFEPERIKATTTMPEDFASFWAEGRKERDAIPLDLQLTPLPAASSAEADSFKVSFGNVDGSRMWGYLSVPKGRPGPFPALVTVESAGLGKPRQPTPYWATRGVIILEMGVHDHDLGLPAAEYEKLEKGRLKDYQLQGIPDRRKYYFRRPILGVDRAIDYIASRPDFDGKHLVVSGSSQGGAFALFMAGMNPHVTAAAAAVPAMCDQSAFLAGRTGAWPLFIKENPAGKNDAALKMLEYFDAVNFVRSITCPVIVSVGFIDRACFPGNVYAAYNEIRSPKRIFNGPLDGHMVSKEFESFQFRWLRGQFGLGEVIEPSSKARRP